MKILFTYYIPSGGMETLNRIRCHALNRTGHECHLLYTQDGTGRKNIEGIATYVTSDDSLIRQLMERERYDVIVVCTDIALLQKIHSWRTGEIIVYEIQGLGAIESARSFLAHYAGLIRENADALLYPDTWHLKEIMESTFKDMPRFCLDDPLDTEHFGYIALPKRPSPIMGWIGRLEPNKNWNEFLLLGSHLLASFPDMYLWMFDDDTLAAPSEKIAFEQTVRNLRLEHRLFRFSNLPHEQMDDYLSIIGDSGGFLCSTSVTEGFGYAVAEAMLCRCPVLATDSDGVRRMIRHNETGKFYTRGDIAHAISEAHSLMTDKKLRDTIIHKAQEHIRRQFSSDLYVKRFSRMLDQLSEGRSRR